MKHLLLFESYVANTKRSPQQIIRVTPGDYRYDTWEDTEVPTLSCTLKGSEEDTNKMALIMDKVSELFSFPEPIVTSGYRDERGQAIAMLDLWMERKSKYIIDLYSKCKSCPPDAGRIASDLTRIWDESMARGGKCSVEVKRINPASGEEKIITKRYPISQETFDETVEALKNRPVSLHQLRRALDYGTNSNETKDIVFALSFIQENGLADLDLIDETKGDKILFLFNKSSKNPHWHVSVKEVTSEGEKFLNISNQEIMDENLFNFKTFDSYFNGDNMGGMGQYLGIEDPHALYRDALYR